MKKSQFFLFLILFVVLVSSSFFIASKWLDPDFGWHLRTGQLILQQGVPHQDWYSYTMPQFPWIDHEWLTDVVIYKIYSLLGFNALLFIFLAFYAASFFIIKKPGQSFFDLLLPILFGYCATVGFLGIRPQLLTVLFIAILWKVLAKFLAGNSKAVYFLPVLFVAWVNLHAGFFAGLIILLGTAILEVFKKTGIIQKVRYLDFLEIKEQSRQKISVLAGVLAVSFFATLVNPYGLSIYREVFGTIGDHFLKLHITEWMPLWYTASKLVPFYTFLFIFAGIVFIAKFRKKIDLNHTAFCLLFLFLAFSSQRYFLIFVIFTIPLFADIFSYVRQEVKLKVSDDFTWEFFLLLIAMIFLSFFVAENALSKAVDFSPDSYPDQAISFLKTQPLSQNMFNEYGFGGYLIWKLPERKVFIDGRMPSWRAGGQFAFGDYIKVIDGADGWQNILQKYDVKMVLLKREFAKGAPLKSPEAKTSNGLGGFLKKYGLIGLFSNTSSASGGIYSALIGAGWKVVYTDQAAVILTK